VKQARKKNINTGDLLDPGIKPRSPELQADSCPAELPEKLNFILLVNLLIYPFSSFPFGTGLLKDQGQGPSRQQPGLSPCWSTLEFTGKGEQIVHFPSAEVP